MEIIKRLVAEEEGADAVEYALIIAFIALAIVAGATTVGGAIGNKLASVGGQVTNCPTSLTSC